MSLLLLSPLHSVEETDYRSLTPSIREILPGKQNKTKHDTTQQNETKQLKSATLSGFL